MKSAPKRRDDPTPSLPRREAMIVRFLRERAQQKLSVVAAELRKRREDLLGMPRVEKRTSPARHSRPRTVIVRHHDIPRPLVPQELSEHQLAKVQEVFGSDERVLSVKDIRFLCQELSLFYDDEQTLVKALKEVGVSIGSESITSAKLSVDDFVGLVMQTASNTTRANLNKSDAEEATLFQRCGRYLSAGDLAGSHEYPFNGWMLKRHLTLLGLPSDSPLDVDEEVEILVDGIGEKPSQRRSALEQGNQTDVKKISVHHWATSVVNPLEQSMQRKSGQPTFIPADSWQGHIAGYFFSVGVAGLGYYVDRYNQKDAAQVGGLTSPESREPNEGESILVGLGSQLSQAKASHPAFVTEREETESPKSELIENGPQLEELPHTNSQGFDPTPVASQGSGKTHRSLPSKWFTDCRPKVLQPRPEQKAGSRIQTSAKTALENSQRELSRKKSRVLEDIRSGMLKRDEGWDVFLTSTELHNLRSEKSVRDVLTYVALRYLAFRRSLEALTPIQKAVLADVPQGCSTAARSELLHQEHAAWNAWREQYSKIRRSTDDMCSRTAEERLMELEGFADVQPLRERGTEPLANEQTEPTNQVELVDDEAYRHLTINDFKQFLASLQANGVVEGAEERKLEVDSDPNRPVCILMQRPPTHPSPTWIPSKPPTPQHGATASRVRKMEYAIDRWRHSKESAELESITEKVEKLLQKPSKPAVLPRRNSKTSTPCRCQPPRVARVVGTLQRAGHSTVEFRERRRVTSKEDFVIA